MSTTKKVEAGSMLAVAALVLILVAIGFVRAPGPNQVNSAGDAAWSERLTQQAEQLQGEARAARAADALSQRLSGLAAINFPGINEFERGAVGMSERAINAWADRLTGLAGYYAAQE
jgi:hypothetical protein